MAYSRSRRKAAKSSYMMLSISSGRTSSGDLKLFLGCLSKGNFSCCMISSLFFSLPMWVRFSGRPPPKTRRFTNHNFSFLKVTTFYPKAPVSKSAGELNSVITFARDLYVSHLARSRRRASLEPQHRHRGQPHRLTGIVIRPQASCFAITPSNSSISRRSPETSSIERMSLTRYQ